jgi:branched-chain amino acid transport system ATP-binding protein
LATAAIHLGGAQALMRAPPEHGAAPLLQIEHLEVIYQRAITAIQGISLRVADGSITAIVGTNGAGKSTTLAAVAGFIRADDAQVPQGRITFAGHSLAGLRSYQISNLGIGLVPERKKIFPTMTVIENLEASRATKSTGSRRVFTLEEIFTLFPPLAGRRHSVAGYLSGGERQMLALSMALVNAPRLLMIDEMSLGLAPLVVEQLQQVVNDLRRESGLTFLVVEQNASMALDLADYTYVMENGRIVFDGTSERLRAHPDFQEFYLGLGQSGDRHYQDVKQYRRKRRWFG